MKILVLYCIIAIFTVTVMGILITVIDNALLDALHDKKMMSYPQFWKNIAHNKEIKLVDLAYLITGAALWGWLLYVMVYAITVAVKKLWKWL